MTLSKITDADEADIKAYQQELIHPAALLSGLQKLYGDKVHEQTKAAYGRMTDAHLLIMGVLSAVLLRVSGKIVPVTSTSDERDALFASFVIGIPLCESAIEQGRYLQALNLLRQEMETLAQLIAVRLKKRNEKRSPNISVLEKSLARMYDELSAAAHVSKHDIVRAATKYEVAGDEFPGPPSGTRQFPAFERELARRAFNLHLMLTLWIISEMSIDFDEQHDSEEGFTEREAEALKLAERLMQAEGMIKIGEILPMELP